MTPAPQAVFVTLVGAGPGDPELLTLKAVKALQQATVILVDDLVHPDVLAHANPQARIVQVGKRGGCQSTPQAFIEKLMAQEALAGESVVRLKGGDPLIFQVIRHHHKQISLPLTGKCWDAQHMLVI